MKYKKSNGFTLIEVLIALAILSIALTAIIHTTAHYINQFTYLKNKTIATWVGLNVMNELKLGIRKLPVTEDFNQETTAFNLAFLWRANLIDTPNERIKKIRLEIKESNTKKTLTALTSYIYTAQGTLADER